MTVEIELTAGHGWLKQALRRIGRLGLLSFSRRSGRSPRFAASLDFVRRVREAMRSSLTSRSAMSNARRPWA